MCCPKAGRGIAFHLNDIRSVCPVPVEAQENVLPDSLSIPERLTVYFERQRWLLLAFVTLLYFTGTLAVAAMRPLWYDEIFTAYLARLGSTTQLWAALSQATDVTPPLFNLITRESVLLFGPTELALRLPETIGFWVMSLCIFAFVYKRSSILYAIAALLVPICIHAGVYASEARPYGLLLGGCGIALVCWQAAADGHRRVLAITGLALSLAATTSVHYYGALFVFPLTLGESIRTFQRKKMDWPVFAALLAAPIALLLHQNWIRIAMTYSGGEWSAISLGALVSTYSVMLGKYTPVAFAGIILTIGMMLMNRTKGYSILPATPAWEMAAIAGMILLPIVVIFVAFITNGIFTFRYALPSIIGFAVAIAVVPLRTARQTATLGLGYVVIFTGAFVGLEVWHVRHFFVQREPSRVARLARVLERYQQPIAIADSHQYLALAYYAPAELRSRLYYIASPRNARRLINFDDDDRSLLLLRDWAPLQVSEYEPFLKENSHFLLYGRPNEGWLLSKCLEEQVDVQAGKLVGENMLMVVNGRTPLGADRNSGN